MKTLSGKWKVSIVLCILAVFCVTSSSLAQESPFDKAVCAYLKKDFKTTVKYLKEYTAKKPDPYAYYLLGYAFYKMKKHPESVKYFEEAYVLDPTISPSSMKALMKKKC